MFSTEREVRTGGYCTVLDLAAVHAQTEAKKEREPWYPPVGTGQDQSISYLSFGN